MLSEEITSGRAKLCLGHASIGAYSCFGAATEGLDGDRDGYCLTHAAMMQEEMEVFGQSYICTKCAHLVWNEDKTVGQWEPLPDCVRCGGSGKELLL